MKAAIAQELDPVVDWKTAAEAAVRQLEAENSADRKLFVSKQRGNGMDRAVKMLSELRTLEPRLNALICVR